MSLLSPHHRELPYLVQVFQAGGHPGLGPRQVGFDLDELATLGAPWQAVENSPDFSLFSPEGSIRSPFLEAECLQVAHFARK